MFIYVQRDACGGELEAWHVCWSEKRTFFFAVSIFKLLNTSSTQLAEEEACSSEKRVKLFIWGARELP